VARIARDVTERAIIWRISVSVIVRHDKRIAVKEMQEICSLAMFVERGRENRGREGDGNGGDALAKTNHNKHNDAQTPLTITTRKLLEISHAPTPYQKFLNNALNNNTFKLINYRTTAVKNPS
jgi:hypothetical protein